MQGADMSLQKNKDRVQDLFEEHVFKYLKSNERAIVEGINLLENKYRTQVLKHPMIVLGLSALKAGVRAGLRNKNREGGEGWKELYMMTKINMQQIEPVLRDFRKDIKKIANADIKVYKI
jgi:hypothetical protein